MISLRKDLVTVSANLKGTFSLTSSRAETSSHGTTISIQHSKEVTDKTEAGAKIEVPFAKFLEFSGSLSRETKEAIVSSYGTEKVFNPGNR